MPVALTVTITVMFSPLSLPFIARTILEPLRAMILPDFETTQKPVSSVLKIWFGVRPLGMSSLYVLPTLS